MQFKTIFFVASMLLFYLGCSMVLPLFTAWFYDENIMPYLNSALIMICVGGIFTKILKPKAEISLSARESIAIVAFAWISAGFSGTIPYLFASPLSFTDALFESVSGFTTTGATILSDIEALPRGLLMWRAQTQWLGGMGIIVLTLAILPMLGMGGMQLYKAEVTGPQKDKILPRIHDTAFYLWLIYFLFTIILFFLLMFGGLDWFNALAHTFTTVATAGFSTQNASIMYYSPFIQWTIIVFMFLAGINFALHYQALATRNLTGFTKNTELKVYTSTAIIATVIITTLLLQNNYFSDFEEALRTALFQVVSILTSSGFATADYLLWPFLAQAIILMLMIMGGSAGSTSGGFKVMRVILLAKIANKEISRVLHPRAVYDIKHEGHSVSQDVLNGVSAFAILYVFIVLAGGLIICGFGHDFVTAFTASASAFSNTGPAFGNIGPVLNFGFFEAPVKYLLCIIMLIGRLEIFTILLLFLPAFWKK